MGEAAPSMGSDSFNREGNIFNGGGATYSVGSTSSKGVWPLLEGVYKCSSERGYRECPL